MGPRTAGAEVIQTVQSGKVTGCGVVTGLQATVEAGQTW